MILAKGGYSGIQNPKERFGAEKFEEKLESSYKGKSIGGIGGKPYGPKDKIDAALEEAVKEGGEFDGPRPIEPKPIEPIGSKFNRDETFIKQSNYGSGGKPPGFVQGPERFGPGGLEGEEKKQFEKETKYADERPAFAPEPGVGGGFDRGDKKILQKELKYGGGKRPEFGPGEYVPSGYEGESKQIFEKGVKYDDGVKSDYGPTNFGPGQFQGEEKKVFAEKEIKNDYGGKPISGDLPGPEYGAFNGPKVNQNAFLLFKRFKLGKQFV